MANSPCIGVLLAAGRGRRMGGAKQFHRVTTLEGEKPLVVAAFDAVESVCDRMIVVLGHRADEVAALLADRDFEIVISDPDAPMFDSVCAGLRAAQKTNAVARVLLHPGDHPEVAATTLQTILTKSDHNPGQAIVPEHQGHGGHPAIIPPAVVEQIVGAECPRGLRQFWVDHPELCLRVAVDDSSVVRDIDTRSTNSF